VIGRPHVRGGLLLGRHGLASGLTALGAAEQLHQGPLLGAHVGCVIVEEFKVSVLPTVSRGGNIGIAANSSSKENFSP
jgi:hypothetical protein